MGRYTARLRQSRRRMRLDFQIRTSKLKSNGFHARKAAWISSGHTVCRHGTFFETLAAGFQCPCMSVPPGQGDRWSTAKYMPEIDADLMKLVVKPFNATTWRKLRPLQNQLRAIDER